MEESSPSHVSPNPSHSYNSSDSDRTSNSERSRSSDSDRETKIYTFSEERGYNSNESVNDIFEEVTSYNSNQPPPPRKRLKRTLITVDQTLDLISALPDSVLLHILSFLPTEYAVTTGTLSKRWQYLWTSVPNLGFRHCGSWNEGIREFVSFVNQTLLLYGCSNVRKFYIEFEYQKCFESRVNCWVRFATRHNVEELDLRFYGEEDMYPSDGEHYTLPQFIYTYASLKMLNLRFCEVVPNGVINWRLLKNLSISYARLSNDLVEKILSGSPVLECLELYRCGGISRLDVKSASLKKLVINDYWDSWDLNDDVLLEISGPNMESLGILGFLYRKKCRVRNVSSLVETTLNFRLFEFDSENDYEEYRSMLRAILQNLHHVKELTIGTWLIQVLSICKMKALPSPLSKCHYLKLDTYLNSWDLPGIASLLHGSPDLETLVINMNSLDDTFGFDADFSSSYDFDGRKYWTSQKMNFRDSLLNLKTVKLVGFIAHHSVTDLLVPLLQILLKNASVLERMVIYPQKRNHSRGWMHGTEDFLKVGQSLLSFPRSSPHAEIIFSDIQDSY